MWESCASGTAGHSAPLPPRYEAGPAEASLGPGQTGGKKLRLEAARGRLRARAGAVEDHPFKLQPVARLGNLNRLESPP